MLHAQEYAGKKLQTCRIPYTKQEFDMTEGDTLEREAGESDDDFWEREYEWRERTRRVILPNPEEFHPPPINEVCTFKSPARTLRP